MYRQLLFFFYSLLIDINNIIGINIFLFPFYLYLNTTSCNIILFLIISFLFIILFITNDRIKNHFILKKNESQSYLYYLSDYFYYISLLCIINANAYYINKIVNLYNNISFFYNLVGIIIILFLFILIKNKTSNTQNILLIIQIIIFVLLIYFLFTIKNIFNNIKSINTIKNIFNSVPFLFFSFLGNNYVIYSIKNEDSEDNTDLFLNTSNTNNNKIFYIKTVIIFLIINIIYIFFYTKIISAFHQNNFFLNQSISEILLKNYTDNRNPIIHFFKYITYLNLIF